MPSATRSLGLAALGWWLAARGLSEPIEESFTRLDPAGSQRLGKSSRLAALTAVRSLGQALREVPAETPGQTDLFGQGTSWLDRFDTVLNTPRVGLRLEKALIGDTEDFAALLEVELAEDRSLMLAARLAAWLRAQVGENDEPAALAAFLAQGWTASGDRRVTFLDEFLVNLRSELSDAPVEITMPLGDPSEFLEWLESQAGRPVKTEEPPPAALDLPPPSPPTPPAPPLDLVESEQEPEPAIESAEPELPAPAPQVPPAAVEAVHEEAVREHRQLRRWALLAQVGWLALLFVGWRVIQQHRPTPQAPTPKSSVGASTTPAATVAPASAQGSPASPRLSVKPAADVPATASKPLPPEMSVAQNELHSQALAMATAGNHAEAVALFRRLVQLQSQDRSTGRLPRALVYSRMAASLAALERWDEADASVERAQALLEELLPTHDAETALGVEMVADYWASRERWPLAARLYQKAVQTYEDTTAENSVAQLSTVNRLAGALRQIGEMKRAEQLYRQLVKAYAGAGAAVATDAASASHNLANVLLVTNRTGEALTHYEAAFAWLTKAPPSDEQAKRMVALMLANYERCLTATGLPAAEVQERLRKVTSAPRK